VSESVPLCFEKDLMKLDGRSRHTPKIEKLEFWSWREDQGICFRGVSFCLELDLCL
jgi:hypothetical protein